LVRFFTALLFFVTLAVGNARAADSYAGIYEYFVQRGVVYSKLGPEINQALTNLLRVAEPRLTLAVNSDRAADVQVIVVNANAAENHTVASVKRFEEVLDAVKGNMLALSTSKIIIDKNFVSKLMLNAWLDQIQAGYGFDEAFKTGGSDIHNFEEVMASRYNPIGDYGRYRFLNRWRSGLIDPTYADDLSKVDVGLEGTLFTAALAPVLLHELGHLRQETAGNFLDIIGNIIDLIRTPRIRAAEDNADAYASEKITAYLTTLSKNDYSPALIGLTATVKLLRDELIEEGFSGVRGLQASDYFSGVYSGDCQEKPSYMPPDVLYDRAIVAALGALYGEEVESFIAPQAVLFADVTDSSNFPLLTKAEFGGLRDRIVKSQNASHAHRILRAERVAQAVKKAWEARPDSDKTRQKDADRTFAQFMGAPGELLTALVNDDEHKLAPTAPFMHTHATFDKVAQELPALTFAAPANCGSPACRIGTFKDGSPGFVEFHGDVSGIAMIRAVLPVKFTDTSPSGQQAAGKYVEVMSKLLLESLGEVKASDMAAAQSMKSFVMLRFFLTHTLQCGVFSGRVDDVDPVVSFRAVNPEGWIELQIHGVEAKK
jgi:hypothetical protein